MEFFPGYYIYSPKNEKVTFKCAEAFSTVVKTPDDSTTYSAPKLPQGISEGFLELKVKAHKTKLANQQCVRGDGTSNIATR